MLRKERKETKNYKKKEQLSKEKGKNNAKEEIILTKK